MKRIFREVSLVLIAAVGTTCLATACVSGAGGNPSPADKSGWQKHEYSFVSLGFTSIYSCDGLADKLKILLLAAGARADAKAQPGACPSAFGHPDTLARADLVFYTLMPDAVGTWRAVELTPRSPRELSLGDCELVEQFRAQVLPMFATRNLEDQTTCIPHQDSGSVINLKFEAYTGAEQTGAVPADAAGTPSKRP